MKNTLRAASLAAALTLSFLASASGAGFGLCRYDCRNTATGQITVVSADYSQADCCDGNVNCPTGSTYLATLSFSGSGRPMFCTPL